MADTPHAERRKTAMRRSFLAFAFALALVDAGCGADNSTTNSGPPNSPTKACMKIRLKVEDKVVTATLIESKASRDFVSLLPLTLTMNDLFRREKYGHLPRPISEEGRRAHTYKIGQIAYWAPGPDVAIYYRQDGQPIPDPGIVVLGTINCGVEAFDVPGATRVTIELVK